MTVAAIVEGVLHANDVIRYNNTLLGPLHVRFFILHIDHNVFAILKDMIAGL